MIKKHKRMKYSIGITTYEHRFEKYLKPLISKIKEMRPEIEILVSVNGENNKQFNEEYRTEVLSFLSGMKNTFVTTYPTYRGLGKLWNNLLANSSNHLVLLLNDDVTITGDTFFKEVELLLSRGISFFKINQSWSHAMVDRRVVDDIGWFDERYLSIGEEDGDFEWRYGQRFNTPLCNTLVPHIVNHVDHDNCLLGMEKVNGKYSKFNLDFAFGTKYRVDPEGKNYGIMNRSVICDSPTPPQHTAERFYWEHKEELKI